MTRKKPATRDTTFRLAPGELRPYWRDSIGGSLKARENIFAAAREAEAEGHVSLHVRRDPVTGEPEYVARGRVR